MNSNPKYTVIIPCYNEEDSIEAMLDSLVKQNIRPNKVVVVNDNSTDGTEKILTKYVEAYPFVSYVNKISQKNKREPGSKVVEAFYYGMSSIKEKYDYISKLDADIVLPLNYFERILEIFSENASVGMAGGVIQIKDVKGNWKDEGKVDNNHLRGAIKTYSKTCFEKIGGIKKTIGWDTIDVILAKHYGFEVFVDQNLKVRLLYPTGARYQKEHARKVGKGMYKMRYNFFVAFISCLKAGWVRKNGKFFLNAFIKGYLKSAIRKDSFSVTKEEGKIIYNYRIKGFKKKLSKIKFK